MGFWKRLIVGIGSAALTAFTALATYAQLSPKINVAPTELLNRVDPASTAFEVQNNGSFAVYSVTTFALIEGEIGGARFKQNYTRADPFIETIIAGDKPVVRLRYRMIIPHPQMDKDRLDVHLVVEFYPTPLRLFKRRQIWHLQALGSNDETYRWQQVPPTVSADEIVLRAGPLEARRPSS